MPVANYSIVVRQVISLLNAQGDPGIYPLTVTDIGTSKRTADEIKEAVIQSDIEARTAICETPGNGFRSSFIGAPTILTPLSGNAQSALLPERIGPVVRVEIRANAVDISWIPGEQAPLNEIREMIAHPEVFGFSDHNSINSPTAGFYYIDETSDIISWTGNAVRVYVATLGTVDRITPTLQTPDAYTPFLIARSLARLYKHGDIASFSEWYARQADALMMLIRRGERVLPQIEPLLRAA